MSEAIQSFATGTLGLTFLLIIAVSLSYTRKGIAAAEMYAIKRLVFLGIILHGVHLSEESFFEFYVHFPQLLGLTPWPFWLFLTFNLAWLVIWIACLSFAQPNAFSAGMFWFLGIASAVNGLAHPAFSIAIGDYFPGLYSSPFVGALGIMLSRMLWIATKR